MGVLVGVPRQDGGPQAVGGEQQGESSGSEGRVGCSMATQQQWHFMLSAQPWN